MSCLSNNEMHDGWKHGLVYCAVILYVLWVEVRTSLPFLKRAQRREGGSSHLLRPSSFAVLLDDDVESREGLSNPIKM